MQPNMPDSELNAMSRYGTENHGETFLRQTAGLNDKALLERLQDAGTRQRINEIVKAAETDENEAVREIGTELQGRITEIMANPEAIEKAWGKRQPRGEEFYTDYSAIPRRARPGSIVDHQARIQDMTGEEPLGGEALEELKKAIGY